MNLLDTINKNYFINKKPLELRGLQDSNYWDGLWIREYVAEYLPQGGVNPLFKDFRNKPFQERGYYFLGHGNGLSFNISAENTEINFESTAETQYLKGKTNLEITAEIGTKFSKLLAKLGASGTLIKKPEPVKDLVIAKIEIEPDKTATPESSSLLPSDSFIKVSSNIDITSLTKRNSIKFSFPEAEVKLVEKPTPESLTDNSFFIDVKENSLILKIAPKDQKRSLLSITYTGNVESTIVGYGGESRENKTFNIVQIYNDPISGKVSYREAFKCILDPSRSITFRGQNATDGGATQSLKFTASEDVTRPEGERLFIEKDDWDMSLRD